MKIKKSRKTLPPNYPSLRQVSESRALLGLATIGLSAMTGLGNPASTSESPIRLRGEPPAGPSCSSSATTNAPAHPPKLPGAPPPVISVRTEPRRLMGLIAVNPSATNLNNSTVYQVKAGDTLPGLARDYLGNADRWPEITAINPGLTEETMKAGRTVVIPTKSPAAK